MKQLLGTWPKASASLVIGTLWVFWNKLEEDGNILRNKSKLVDKGYNQQGGIDFNETDALVARLEAIKILLSFSFTMNLKLFQMDVRRTFLNVYIQKEV